MPGPTVPNNVGGGPRVGVSTGSMISSAVGSFDSVSDVASVTSRYGANDYALQLNTNTFRGTAACDGAQPPAGKFCNGWQQFIFSQGQCGKDIKDPVPCVFIEYWLYDWGVNNPNPCPGPLKLTKEGNCFLNGRSVSPPQQTIANLGNLSLTAAASMGGMDAVIFSTGNNLYMVQESDSILDLAASWTEFSYNLVGDGDSSEATFNSGSSEVANIVVRASVDSGSPSAPSCVTSYRGGDTGEYNNLYLQPVPSVMPRSSTQPALVYTENSNATRTTPCHAASLVPAASKLTDTHDFNGDGFSDIVWGDTSGDVAVWLMSSAQVTLSGTAGTAPTTWSIVGQRDFNGDGTYDLLWLDTSGDLAIWFMIGTQVFSSAAVGNVGTAWSVAGTADFNNDGKGDILWRDSSGNTAIWLMNGASALASVSLGNIATNFSVAGTGDFNGDGYADILWDDGSGNYSIWFMTGTAGSSPSTSVLSTAAVGNIATTWSVVGTGDFNGDHMTDIAWRDTAGDTAIWLMNGASVLSAGGLGNVPTMFSIALVGDYNGDGMSDLLWQDNVGDTSIWIMNGTAVSLAASVGNIPTTWTIQSLNAE